MNLIPIHLGVKNLYPIFFIIRYLTDRDSGSDRNPTVVLSSVHSSNVYSKTN